ncbi:MAG: hypothetical protein Q8R72_02600 [Hylemonella sp.]|nr:hypothetical protein [Hylemonella sp.]
MAIDTSLTAHAEQIASVMGAICTRTLNHFAEEAKLNGESLKDALDRYEIDYAWHVLGSERLHAATVACLQTKHRHAASDAQKASVSSILQAAAAAQPAELLMSFDNDVPEQLADALCVAWTGRPLMPAAAEAA